MKKISLNSILFFVLILFYAGGVSQAFSQVPASLEKEVIQFNSDIYDALKIIQNQNEKEAVAKLQVVKPKLIQKAQSLSVKISSVPDLSEAEEEALTQRMMENQVFQDMMTLLSNPEYLQKIENSQVLQREFEELMAIMELGLDSEEEQASLPASQACSFVVGSGSPLSGNYTISASEDQAFAYNDIENEQFVIEIHGENYLDVMLIIEKPVTGKHTFTMEMQVAIDVSKNDGEDYFGLDNYQEEGGGYIQIDRIDDIGGIVSGSFSGKFNDSSTEDDRPVNIDGRFSVTRIRM
jgi:hypothetical protein